MPALDTEAQFKFLLCCIKHSTAGKVTPAPFYPSSTATHHEQFQVNFNEVASELGIISKAAAAKRYERLLKSHDITVSTPRKSGKCAASGKGKDENENDSEPKEVKTPASRKRKRGQASTAAKDDEDEDEYDTPVKNEKGTVKKEKGLKKEEDASGDVKVKKEAAAANVVDYISE
ncbi:hypothetical protein MMYC01_201376 [Madurella mycetomatis]|uniref:Myb-like DNA-binding domain-containing protein n=1 Tax=Madurella mycetomatis TaxID=100816 RepID=A0A175WDL0_9PEZI|nr:hypothetical protein MMYC01_201376 [Madurella mycetomatis]